MRGVAIDIGNRPISCQPTQKAITKMITNDSVKKYGQNFDWQSVLITELHAFLSTCPPLLFFNNVLLSTR